MWWEHLWQQEDRFVQASSRHETVIIISLQYFHSFSRVLISLGQSSNDDVRQKGLGLFPCIRIIKTFKV